MFRTGLNDLRFATLRSSHAFRPMYVIFYASILVLHIRAIRNYVGRTKFSNITGSPSAGDQRNKGYRTVVKSFICYEILQQDSI